MIGWGIETLAASTLLMILVLVAREPVRKWVGPQIAYALWALPVLRMLLPPMPDSWHDAGVAPVAIASEAISQYVALPMTPLPDAGVEAGLPWAAMLLGVWIAGAVAFGLYHLIAYLRFCLRLQRGARSNARIADGRVTMIESDAAAGPLAFGVWRKYVAFPSDFAERYDELERDLALAHELGHHARGDLLANWIALAVLAIHWFNPVAWRAFRAFRADQEMACDALVLSGRHPALRHAYGRAIVKSAHGGAVSAACHLHTVNEIKGRLRMLTRHQKPSAPRRHMGAAGIATLTLAALAITASGTQAAEGIKAKVAERTGVSIDDIDMPKLPLPVAQAEPAPPPPPEPEAPLAPRAAPSEPRRVTRIVRTDTQSTVTRDGQAIDRAELDRMVADGSLTAAQADKIASIRIPEIREGRCGGNGPTSMTVKSADGRTVRTVICTDRIEQRVSQAQWRAHQGEQSVEVARRRTEAAGRRAEAAGRRAAAASHRAASEQRIAMASAQGGLAAARASVRSARASIVANPHMSDKQRSEALASLDEAIRQIEQQHARVE